MKKIDIVIVNWNAGLYLQECVESVIKYSNDLVNKIVVVDNSSTDNSLLLISELPELVLIENSENLGFAKGCNIGAKICSSEYILFLNPDARIYEDTLRACLFFLNDKKNASTGILGVPLEDANGDISRSCSRYPSIFNVASNAIGLDKLIPSLGASMKEWDHSTTRVVDQVIGAFFLVRRGVYKKLNGFDERFFVYYEEVDFSYRAKKEGYKSTYYSGAKAFHYGGISSGKVISSRLFFSLRSRVQYFHKHFSAVSTLFVLLITLFIEFPARLIYAIFVTQSYTLSKEVIKGYRMFFVSLFKR